MLPEAAEQLMQTRWSEGGAKNLAAAWKQWSQHCETMLQQGYTVDKMDPTPIELVNFLRAIRKGEYRAGAKKNEQVSGGWVRGMWYALSDIDNSGFVDPALFYRVASGGVRVCDRCAE